MMWSIVLLLLFGFCQSAINNSEGNFRSLLSDIDVNKHYNEIPNADDDDDFEVEFVYPRMEGSDSVLSPLQSVRRLWGVSDIEAPVGKLFLYTIPEDAFQGDIASVEVNELPSFLQWNSIQWTLTGVPLPSDAGHHYITIEAYGSDGSSAKDVFAIHVRDIPESKILQDSGCPRQGDVTVLSLVLDVAPSALRPSERARILDRAAHTLGTSVSEVSLAPSVAGVDPLAYDSAILAGPGSAVPLQGGLQKTQTLVQWVVGCGGEVSKNGQVLVNHTEILAADGTLQAYLSVPIIGWFVAMVNPKSKRIKRQAEHSGDSEDDYDYYENFNYDDYFDKIGWKGAPKERVIPPQSTPVFATEKTRTYITPVLKPIPISTPVYIPVKPTRVVEPSPTTSYKPEAVGGYSLSPSLHLESSILVQPTEVVESTVPLPATTTVLTTEPTSLSSIPEMTSVPTVGETTQYGVKNFAPRIANRIPKLAWIAGNVYRMQIPDDTFEDTEDGTARNLRLIFKDDKYASLPNDSWIQFDPAKQEIYALPLEEHVGKYNFHLQAIDSEGKYVIDSFKINVQQSRQARNFHHKFSVVLKLEKNRAYEFVYSLDWQVKAIEKIANYFNDTTDSINVRSITADPVSITWTNVTLVDPSSAECPSDQLEAVTELLTVGDSEPTKEFKDSMFPEFQVKRVGAYFLHPCEDVLKPIETLKETEGVLPTGRIAATDNEPPIFRNPIDSLEASVGQLFRYQVPHDTCYDFEDGDSRRLMMNLLTLDTAVIPADSWLQFDSTNQEFFGLPLKIDASKAKSYILECIDKGGEKVSEVLTVTVGPVPHSIPPVKFVMSFSLDYRNFMSNGYDKAKMVEKIGEAFGDPGPEYVVVDSIEPGSVVITWHNASLPSEPCPEDTIHRLRELMTDQTGQLKQDFRNFFLPEFPLVEGRVVPSGECLSGDTPTHVEMPEVEAAGGEQVPISEEDYILTYIIPAVIIAVMLLLAAIIACCLYRRRRYGKMTMADDRTFVSKGIPIIFAEELDDHHSDPARSPVIMKEEKPPLPPPEYQRNSPPVGVSSTPPKGDRRSRPHSGVDPSSKLEDTPYHPPPPFTASNGANRNQRPNLPPAYRKPPTYVPP